MFNTGLQQARQSEPLSAVSVLTFHDSVELFLQLVCEKNNIRAKDVEFMQYWTLIETKAKITLGQKATMDKLNRIRVQLKHYGVIPSKPEIEAARVNVTNFFEENTTLVFGTKFATVSMIELVRYTNARTDLDEAEKLMHQGDTKGAIVRTAIAFSDLIQEYETDKLRYGTSPFTFGKNLRFESIVFKSKDVAVEKIIKEITGTISSMQDALKIVSLGIDYRKYSRFKSITPTVIRISKKLVTMNPVLSVKVDEKALYSADNYEFCYNFVIEAAIHLQGFEFEIKEGNVRLPTLKEPDA